MAKKPKPSTLNWLDDAEEVPRANTVAAVDRSKRQRFYRRFITATIILLPMSLGVNVLMYGQVGAGNAVVAEQFVPDPEGKAAAIIAVEEWLAQEISPLPGGGRIVSWDSAELVVKPAQTNAESKSNPLPAFNIETHHFTLVDGTGVTYRTDVAVAIDAATGAHVMSSPSAIPNALAGDGGSAAGASPWFGLTSATAPSSVQDAVSAWAKVYTSGDPNALRLAVQDDDGQHTYVPLSNVTNQTVVITRSAYLPTTGQTSGAAPAKNAQMVVQVTLAIQWSGVAEPQSGAKIPTITLDLLVSNAGGAAPIVVAWGGPGSGPTLTAYINALTGRSSESAQVVTPAPSETAAAENPTDTPTGGPDSTEGD
jgi:hypothetical protein